MKTPFLVALSTLVGAIVGLGMFAIPYTAMKAGFLVSIGYIVALGIVMLLIHLMYGEVVERTNSTHGLPGYAQKYLGKRWKQAAGLFVIFSVYTALLAYIIVGGKLLALAFPSPIDPFVWSIIFWLVLSLSVWRGVKTVGLVELFMSALLIVFVVVLFVWGVPDIEPRNFSTANFRDLFLPYGVVLFALSGILVIPEIRALLKNDGSKYKRTIFLGTLIPIFVYIIFTALVVGVSGIHTSEESLQGLLPYLGSWFVRLGALFGILAVATSYLALGLNLKDTFMFDWRVRSNMAALMAMLVPLLLFLGGANQFINVLAVSGAVLGATIGVIVALLYRRVQTGGERTPAYVLHLPNVVTWGLMCLLGLGGVYEIIYLVR
jgi:tyrosine-specific transport protein